MSTAAATVRNSAPSRHRVGPYSRVLRRGTLSVAAQKWVPQSFAAPGSRRFRQPEARMRRATAGLPLRRPPKRLLPRCHTFRRRWKNASRDIDNAQPKRSIYPDEYSASDADFRKGWTHESRRAKSLQSIEDLMAGGGGWSGGRATAFCRTRSERATDVCTSSDCAAGERIPKFRSLRFLACYGFGHPSGATELDDAACDSHAAPRTRVPV